MYKQQSFSFNKGRPGQIEGQKLPFELRLILFALFILLTIIIILMPVNAYAIGCIGGNCPCTGTCSGRTCDAGCSGHLYNGARTLYTTVPSTCTTAGYKEYHIPCTREGCTSYKPEFEPLPLASHNYGYTSDNDNDHYQKCKKCGAYKSGSNGPHHWGGYENHGSYHSHTCVDCGRTVTDNHSWGDWYDNGPAEHRRDCKACTAYETQNHNWSSWQDQGNGYHKRTCSTCGRTETADITASDAGSPDNFKKASYPRIKL